MRLIRKISAEPNRASVFFGPAIFDVGRLRGHFGDIQVGIS